MKAINKIDPSYRLNKKEKILLGLRLLYIIPLAFIGIIIIYFYDLITRNNTPKMNDLA